MTVSLDDMMAGLDPARRRKIASPGELGISQDGWATCPLWPGECKR